MKTLGRIVVSLMLIFTGSAAVAQTYPSRPIRLIVPFSPGGTTDAVARTIANSLSQAVGQSVVVENKGGGSTIIGTDALARSDPDGYTIMLATPDFTVNPSLRTNLPYDTLNDFTPITLIATYPMLLLTKTGSGLDSVGELLGKAKTNPNQLNFASAGNGSMPHLCAELLKSLAHIQLTHIPYKGNGPAITDLLSGRVSLLFSGATPVEGFIKADRLKVLAVTGAQRHRSLPDIPTLAESGVPGYDVTAWFGFIAPAGVPENVIKKLNSDIKTALNSPEVRRQLSGLGAELAASTPDEFSSLIKTEIAKWRTVVKTAGIQAG